MTPRPRVALMIESSTVYGRKLLQGITRYLRTHRAWSIFPEQREVDTEPPGWLRTWRGDGIISRWSCPRAIEAIVQTGLPAVDVSDRRPAFGLPRINSDDPAIGRMAAAHLLERGFAAYAICAFSGELWAERRTAAFLDALAGAGHAGRVYESPWHGAGAHVREEEQARIGLWLESLPRPVGVLASNDVRGIDVLNACQMRGLHVPDDAAVIGGDDDSPLDPDAVVVLGPLVERPVHVVERDLGVSQQVEAADHPAGVEGTGPRFEDQATDLVRMALGLIKPFKGLAGDDRRLGLSAWDREKGVGASASANRPILARMRARPVRRLPRRR